MVSEDRVEKETFLFIPFYNEKKKIESCGSITYLNHK